MLAEEVVQQSIDLLTQDEDHLLQEVLTIIIEEVQQTQTGHINLLLTDEDHHLQQEDLQVLLEITQVELVALEEEEIKFI